MHLLSVVVEEGEVYVLGRRGCFKEEEEGFVLQQLCCQQTVLCIAAVCVLSSCSIESLVFADVLCILLETFVDISLIHAPACNIPCGYDFAVLAGCSCNQVLFVCVLLLASMGVPC